MAEHEPEILKRTHKWLLIEDFVNYMLCGVAATDYTMASCTLLFDQRKLDWSDEMLALSGIDRRLLCDAFPSGTVLGGVTPAAAAATGLAAGTPVVLGGHDYLCGALPVGAIKPGVILDVSGTWEIVLASIPAPVLTPAAQRTGVTVEAHVARDLYAVWGGAVSSDMLEWYRKEYGFEAKHQAEQCGGVDWDFLMADAARSPVGARGAMFLPHMSGAGCPVVDSRSLAGFVGLSNFVTKGDMLRAIIEGLDYQFLDIVKTMQMAWACRSISWWSSAGPCATSSGCRTRRTWSGRPSRSRRSRTRRRWARPCWGASAWASTGTSRTRSSTSGSRARPSSRIPR